MSIKWKDIAIRLIIRWANDDNSEALENICHQWNMDISYIESMSRENKCRALKFFLLRNIPKRRPKKSSI